MSDVSAQPQDASVQPTQQNAQVIAVDDVQRMSMPAQQVSHNASDAITSTNISDSVVATSVMQSAQAYDPLNPSHPVGKSGIGAKETLAKGLDALVAEVPGAQAVEVERTAEVPPEVESWVEKVEHHEIQAPHEVVVADQTAQQPTGNYASEPVIILPATQQAVQQGFTQKITESARWLAEWCTRIMKKFHGMVVYRDVVRKE